MIDRAFIEAFDWSRTPIGPYEAWPRSLKGYVSMIVEMPTPAIIFWGPEQTQIYNEGYAAIMGQRHPRYFGARYRECWPDTYELIDPWMQEVLQDGAVKRVEAARFLLTRHERPEHAYFTFTFSPLRDDTGAIAGVFQPVVEVTHRVLMERRAETLRALAMRSSRTGHALSDAATVLDACPEDVPFSLAYLIDEPSRQLWLMAHSGLDGASLSTEWRARIEEAARRVRDTGTEVMIDDLPVPTPMQARSALALPLRRSDVEPTRGVLVLGINPYLQLDEAYRDFVGSVARHVAANERADAALRAEEELLARERAARREAELQKAHLAALFNQAPTPIVVLRGPDLVIELANPHTCQLWGRVLPQVIDRPLAEALPELRGQPFEKLLTRVYRTGMPYVGEAVRARLDRLGDGRLHEVDLSFVYAPLRDVSGAVDGILVIAFDVTDQVRAHEQLEGLRAAAEAASAAKDEFIAMLGHELRNPLAPILTAIELVRREPDDLEPMLDVIERQARHLVRLVGDLLDVSRITQGKVELQHERIDLGAVVHDALEMTGPLLEQREHELTISVEPDLVVIGDRARLAQIVSNLLANAAKFTEPRGRVAVTARREGDWIAVSVRDSGIGIAPDLLPRVFDMFVQERQGSDRTQGGLGLGLTIARRLVELHGGTLSAHSEGRQRGTELTVRLPAAAPLVATATPAAASLTPPPVAACERRRILVVDDNEDAAELLGAWLETLGHTVRVAHDGAEALREAAEFAPDLALLDIGLPVIDGHELARRLRADAQLRAMRLVALTGYGQDSDHERSRAAGFDAHLVKPVELEPLGSLIADLTARGEARPS